MLYDTYKIINKLKSSGFIFQAIVTMSLIIVMNSCNNDIVFRENRHINKSGWNPADSIEFTFRIDDTISPVSLYFNIRNTTGYPYQNLYFFITTKYPDGTFSRDTAECILAANDGRWMGKGKGKTRDSKFLFRKAVRFIKTGEYTLIVNQAMREDVLKGIADVGLLIENPIKK
jgi:gliding motility-associated lipoprotein GldH